MAIAAGTIICRAVVAGSERSVYEPPWPGPKHEIASCATSTASPSLREPKTAVPAS